MDRLVFETKINASDDGSIEGTAWSFKSPDRIGDVITKGAFADAPMPLPMLFGHDQNDPVGVWEEGAENDDGFNLKGRLLVGEVGRADEVHALVKSGAVRGVSIGFQIKSSRKRPKGGRTISSLELLEASLVVIPMHPGARVTAAKDAIAALTLSEKIQRAAAHIRR